MESAKECVTTHLPNQLALKMDGAQAYYLYSTERVKNIKLFQVGRRKVYSEASECKLGLNKL